MLLEMCSSSLHDAIHKRGYAVKTGLIRRGVVPALLAAILPLLTACGSSSFVKRPAGWKTIELRDDLRGNYDKAWQTAIDTLGRSYDLEIIDKDSGYARTAWKFGILGESPDVLAGRITLKFPDVSDVDRVDVRTDVQQYNIWTEQWEQGFDTVFEREIFGDLSGRLGRVVQ
ncbi:MAG: hypothetical protein D6695_02190 [Planctomycetota bacterium]|nr:MAG: hypothetical protein D6695_02190 [Planctomycetota bacterium]